MATVRATVEIFGQRLGLRADGDEARVEEIARFVDFRMREVADRSSSVDTVKIAVLTALNIADELFSGTRIRSGHPAEEIGEAGQTSRDNDRRGHETRQDREGKLKLGGPYSVGDE